MEVKLKAMKVADLKSVLSQAQVPFDAKLTKPALIKKILETPAAAALVDEPDAIGDDDELLAPPPAVNWDDDTPVVPAPVAKAAPAPKPAAKAPAAVAPVKAKPEPAPKAPAVAAKVDSQPTEKANPAAAPTEETKASLEEEAEKRRARAAKWGTSYVEPTAKPVRPAKGGTSKPATSEPVAADKREERKAKFGTAAAGTEEQIKARAQRFGAPVASTSNAPVLDEEELRKRKAREERFKPGAPKKPRLD